MIDVHCHLNFHSFEKDYDELIHKANTDGVEIIINTGTKIDSSAKAVSLAQQYKNLYAIVGVHPHHADKPLHHSGLDPESRQNQNEILKQVQDDGEIWLEQLEKLAKQPKVVAIGEIGMDYYSYKSNGIVDPKLQKDVFEKQIVLAHKTGLPLQIHNRHAGKDILEILRHHKNLLQKDNPGMFHCFAGDMDILHGVLELGFYIGFDGNITYKGLAPGENTSLSDVAKATPLDRIVTETDAPYLTPEPFRGSRNIPSHVILVGEFLAKLKGVSFEEIHRITSENAKRLFNIK